MTTSSSSSSSELPSELVAPIAEFDRAIRRLGEEVSAPLAADGRPSRAERMEALAAAPADRARLDLVSAFAINSVVWMMLKARGVDPRETEAKSEVDRVRGCLQRLKEVEVRQSRHARVDADAAKRFVRSGLWDAKKRPQKEPGAGRGESSPGKRPRRGRK